MQRVTKWLSQAPSWVFGLYAGTMAFGVYFAMYAYRKPFAVATFDGMRVGALDYKVVLVMAQVLGYALAKLVGVRIVAELPGRLRIAGILMQIALAEAALVGFALVPPPWNVACLFVDGLALGMVWGMVFGIIEGRRQSEAITAILCASFIVSSGVVKAAGEAVLLHGVSPFWMPAATGALFAPLLLVCTLGLALLPPPNATDVAERLARPPLDAQARGALLRRYAGGLAALIALYVMLTALRDFRDNFAAEIWRETGLGDRADVFAWTELPIGVAVLGAMAALGLFRDHRTALTVNFALIALGLVLAGAASLGFALHLIGPIVWMTLLGAGLYLSYTPYNGVLFERLVAAGGKPGTAGFFIYVADAFGYGGTVALLLVRDFASLDLAWSSVLVILALGASVLGLMLVGYAAIYFRRSLV